MTEQEIRSKVLQEVLEVLHEEEKSIMLHEKMYEVSVHDELNELGQIENRIKRHFGI